MIDSKKLMKKIFLFILNILLILANVLCLYGYSEAVLKKNFEIIILSLPMLPIFLIIAVIFYFLKNYLYIGKLNRWLPTLAILVYLITIFVDEAVAKLMRFTGFISYNIAISTPTYTCKIIILFLGIILFIITTICTFRSLLKK